MLSVLDVWRWNADAELLRAYAAELDAKLNLALDQVLFVLWFGGRDESARALLRVGDVGLLCGEGAFGRRR